VALSNGLSGQPPWQSGRTNRVGAEGKRLAGSGGLLGDSELAQEKIAEEMGWHRNKGEEPGEQLSVEELDESCEAAMDEPEPEPHREGIDWIRTQDGEIRHPLQHRCFESSVKLWNRIKDLGLEDSDDNDLGEFIFEYQLTGAKLAGALNTLAKDSGIADPGFTVAALKRALDHLHKAQAWLEPVSIRKLLPASLIDEMRKELLEIREGILHLMDEFRGRSR